MTGFAVGATCPSIGRRHALTGSRLIEPDDSASRDSVRRGLFSVLPTRFLEYWIARSNPGDPSLGRDRSVFKQPREHTPAFPRRARVVRKLPPSTTEGVGNAGCPVHPQPRVRMVVVNAHEYSQRVHRKRPAFPHEMVLTVSFALSPVTGLVCHRRP